MRGSAKVDLESNGLCQVRENVGTDLTQELRDGVGEKVKQLQNGRGNNTPGRAGQLGVSSWQTEVGGKPCFDPPSPCLLVPILMFDCSAFSLL